MIIPINFVKSIACDTSKIAPLISSIPISIPSILLVVKSMPESLVPLKFAFLSLYTQILDCHLLLLEIQNFQNLNLR